MTNEEILRRTYPEHFELIKHNIETKREIPGFLEADLELSPSQVLACAFLWHNTSQGHDFWQRIYNEDRQCPPHPIVS